MPKDAFWAASTRASESGDRHLKQRFPGASPDAVASCHSVALTEPMSELPPRADRLAEQLHGASAVIANPATIRWLTGLAGEPHALYGLAVLYAVIGPSAEVRLVAPASEAAWIEELGRLDDDIVTHGDFVLRGAPSDALTSVSASGRTLIDALHIALRAVHADGDILIDDAVVPSVVAELSPRYAARVVPAGPAPFVRARAIKDEDELEALRAVNAVAERAIDATLQAAAVGVTERDLVRVLRTSMVQDDARPMLASVGVGERGALVDFAAS